MSWGCNTPIAECVFVVVFMGEGGASCYFYRGRGGVVVIFIGEGGLRITEAKLSLCINKM